MGNRKLILGLSRSDIHKAGFDQSKIGSNEMEFVKNQLRNKYKKRYKSDLIEVCESLNIPKKK